MNELLPRLGIRYRSTVVDVGFGRAEELLGLADLVRDEGRVYGIEPKKDWIEGVAKKVENVRNITVLTGNALRIPLPNRSTDYVLLKGVLHEVPNVSKALIEGARVCKQEGAILVVDFSAFPNSWLMKSNLKWRLHHPRNLLGKPLDRHPGFSKTNLEGCFKSAGLKIRTYDEVLIGDFGDHRIPMFLAVGEPA